MTATLERNRVYRVAYTCRDIGYGVESGEFVGYWTGEVDVWGKHTFRIVEHLDGPEGEHNPSSEVYLFADEFEVGDPDLEG